MRLANLFSRGRVVLRAFLAMWTAPSLVPQTSPKIKIGRLHFENSMRRASPEIEAARARYRDAQTRRDTRAMHSASQLLRLAMLNELRREVSARKGITP